MRKIRILAACPGPTDATSAYRGLGPLLRLERSYPDEIEIIQGGQAASDYDWPALYRADLLFMQRPSIASHQAIIERAIHHRIPVWIDYDDDLMAVPKSNPCSAQYNHPQVQQAILQCLKLATYVSVSTEKLRQKYSPINPACEVIPNALDDTLFQLRDVPHPEKRQKIIFWRGSNTHIEDLMTYQREILAVYEANPGWQWFFLGYEPWFLTERMKTGTYGTAPWASHIEYFQLIQRIQPQVLMVPLKFDEFNEAKSHIAWLEGTLAGSAVLGPHFTEWQRHGCAHYSDPSIFQEQLQALLKFPSTRYQLREESRVTLEKDYLLSSVNLQRLRAIKNLAETGRSVPK